MYIFSLPYNFDQRHTLLSEINISFDDIEITEPGLKKQTIKTTNIDINKYNLEHASTEASCGGTLLYIKNKLSYINWTRTQNHLVLKRRLNHLASHFTFRFRACFE